MATIAATTESHPLTNFYSSIALMEALRRADTDRVGDLWFAAQRKALGMRKPLIERMLKNVEGALEVEIDIPKLKRDQLQMYAYLGDPALAIALPRELEVDVEKDADGDSGAGAQRSHRGRNADRPAPAGGQAIAHQTGGNRSPAVARTVPTAQRPVRLSDTD